ncbi:hypothetical protein SDC9_142856 [bioreactor metagenome]|uniref:Uncharacterized protein n=1 Tax=bioreactor metagenome TaxID=1076179 RepID=A0A645E2C0_9ZZZZ
MRVVTHRPADHVRHLVEFAVIHLKKRVDDTPLHRLEPVDKIGDCPLLDDVAGIFKKILSEY